MSDLKTQIRLYFDDVVEHVDVDELIEQRKDVVRVPPARPRGRTHQPRSWVYAVAGATVVIFLLGVAFLTPPDPATDPVAPSPTNPAAPFTTPSGPDPSPDDREPFLADSVVGRWVWTPVATTSYWLPHGFADGRFYHTGADQIDVSEDGLTWSSLGRPTLRSRWPQYNHGVVSDMIVAYTVDVTRPERGGPGSRGVVSFWRYQSGAWVEFGEPVEPVVEIDGVRHFPNIYVDVVGPYVAISSQAGGVYAEASSDGWLLVSKDGSSWASADLPAPGIETWSKRQLASLNGGLLALLDQDQLWASDDGLTWTQIEPTGVALAGIPGSWEERVFLVGGDDRVFLLGRGTTWTSPDGRAWQRTDLPSEVQSVWRAPFGWVAVAGAGWFDAGGFWHRTGMPAQIFVSTDGVIWNTIETPPDPCSGSFVGDILFVDTCGEGGGGRWTATLEGN